MISRETIPHRKNVFGEERKMKLQDLKNAVENIEISETMQQEIAQNVIERTQKHKWGGVKPVSARRTAHRLPRIAAAAAGLILAVGVVGIPARAIVSSLVKERMEKIPDEEHQARVEMLDSQPVGADTYTRSLTENEKEREKELWSRYQQGLFPEGELPQTDSEKEAQTYELYYLTTDSSFHLPDRELTDEELLELIDFEVKRNYALQKRYEEEFAEEIEAQEQEKQEAAAEVVDAGGITEQEAVASAKEWLQKLYGITGDGLELHSYFEEVQDAGYDGSGEKNTYMVNWTDMPGRKYYYFYISAQDGSLVWASYSSSDLVDASQTPVTVQEAETKLPELSADAVSFMEDKLELDAEAYVERYADYMVIDEQTAGSRINFVFCSGGRNTDVQGAQAQDAEEAQTGYNYVITYAWDGTFIECCRTKDISTYWDSRERVAQSYRQAQGVTVRQVKKDV